VIAHDPAHRRLSGRQLDAILAAADDEILGYVRANTNPEAVLTALLASGNGSADAGAAPARRLAVPARRDTAKPGRLRAGRRRARIPAGSRRRKRWAAAAVTTVSCLGILAGLTLVSGPMFSSVPLAALLLFPLAALPVTCVVTAQKLAAATRHPWIRRLAARPWRDGRDVLNTALHRLPEAFVEMPSRTLLAPDHVELVMSPADLTSLAELIDIELVNATAAEHYAAAVAAHSAVRASGAPVEVSLISDPAIPAGRYRLRRSQQRRVLTRAVNSHRPGAYDEAAPRTAAGAGAAAAGVATLAKPAVSPAPLRLVTGGWVAETRVSGARAGRGRDAELQLPTEPTVSRVHAQFTFDGNQWRIIGRGRNGLMLNGTPVAGEQVIRAGDSIQWGCQDGALESRVEIG